MSKETAGAATEEKAAKAPKKEKAPKKPKAPQQNGVSRPGEGTSTGKVWGFADSLSAKEGKPASRKAVLEMCATEGINPSTAATQYGRWRKFNGLSGSGKEES